MSADPPAATPQPPPRRRRRWPLGLTWVTALLIAALVVAAWWIIGTKGGARLVVERTAQAFGQGATVTGVEGQLGGTLRVKRIEVVRPDLYVLIDDLEMDTEPLEWGRLLIHRIRAARVEVRTASTGAAAGIPMTFQTPYPVTIEDGRVGELRVGVLGKEESEAKDAVSRDAARNRSRAGDLVIRDFVVKGSGDRTQWTLTEAGAQTDIGTFRLAGTLGTTSPFSLAAAGEFAGTYEGRALRVDARLEGTLKAFEAKLAGDFAGAKGTGSALIQPFDAAPVHAVTLELRDVDLAQYAAIPHTRLAVDMRLAPKAGEFAGPIHIQNAQPGTLDQGRLPFASATANIVFHKSRMDLTDIALALAGGGSARGKAAFEKGVVHAELQLHDANLAAFHGDLRPTRLSGPLKLTGDEAGQRFEAALRDPRFQVEGRGALANDRLDVQTVTLRHDGGSITAKGTLATKGRREFRFEGRAEHFDPAAFVKTQQGDLNLSFVATGTLADGIAGEIKADVAPSHFAGLAAAGQIQLAGDRRRIASADVHVTLGEAKLDAKGSFGRAGDALDVTVHAPDIAVFAKPLGWAMAGSVDAQAHLTGTFAAPAGRIELKGANMTLPADFFARELELRGEAGAEPSSTMDIALRAQGVAHGKAGSKAELAQTLAATLKGTRAAHRLDVDATMARNQALKASLEGGLAARGAATEWRGNVQSLAVTGPSAFTLAAPATLVVGAQQVELGDAAIRAEWGEAHLAVTRWTPQRLELKGTSRGLTVAGVARALRLPNVPRSNLVVAGEWDVRAADTVEGSVSLTRVSGDLRVGDPPLALGLEEMTLKVDAVRGEARALVDIRGSNVGRLHGEATGTLVREASGWGLAGAAPVAGRVDLDLPSLEAFAAWFGPDARAGGKLEAHAVLAGTGADPRWSGSGHATDLKLREPQTGFEIERGDVALSVRERAIVIERFTAAAPWHPSDAARRVLGSAATRDAGTISAAGSIDLAAGSGTIRVKADKVPVTQLPTRFVALSGDTLLEGRKDGMAVSGALKVDAGWIGALATALPTVSDDIVVIRKAQTEPEARRGERIALDIRLALGDHAYFTGRGLSTQLAGEMHILGEPGPGLRATGSIRTVGGTYDAYGQKLTIDRGTLTFYGSLERPAMNVLAVRRGLPIEAGVEVLGTADRPRVRLVSFPDVPEPEKLSWLVLGRSPADVSQGDAATLLAAARAILGRSGSEGDIGRRFGFDDVRIGRSDTTSALGALPQTTVAGRTATASATEVISVGKRLTKDINVVYEQGLADAEGALRITWQITQRFQLLLRAGYLPGVDAVYRWTFR